jgi:hypothetical protein
MQHCSQHWRDFPKLIPFHVTQSEQSAKCSHLNEVVYEGNICRNFFTKKINGIILGDMTDPQYVQMCGIVRHIIMEFYCTSAVAVLSLF